jgi:hypothetical protein
MTLFVHTRAILRGALGFKIKGFVMVLCGVPLQGSRLLRPLRPRAWGRGSGVLGLGHGGVQGKRSLFI